MEVERTSRAYTFYVTGSAPVTTIPTSNFNFEVFLSTIVLDAWEAP